MPLSMWKPEVPPLRVLVFILGTFLLFLLTEGYLILAFGKEPLRYTLWEVLFWGLLLHWSVQVRIHLPFQASMSQLFLLALAMLLLFPSWIAPLMVFFQGSGNTWYKQIFNRSQDALSTAMAGFLWKFFENNPLYLGSWNLSAGVGISTAAIAFFAVNTSLVTTAIYLSSNTPWREIWRKNFKWLAISYFFLSPIALLLARAYETPLIGNWGG
ncbi:MAG: phosphohydrolase, partial [Thermus sp.]